MASENFVPELSPQHLVGSWNVHWIILPIFVTTKSSQIRPLEALPCPQEHFQEQFLGVRRVLLHRPVCHCSRQKQDLGLWGLRGSKMREMTAQETLPTLLIVCLRLLRLVQAVPSLQDTSRWPGHVERHQLITDFPVDSGTLCVARKKRTEIKSSPYLCYPENEVCSLRVCLDDSVSTRWFNFDRMIQLWKPFLGFQYEMKRSFLKLSL